jgi:hypothetical protein
LREFCPQFPSCSREKLFHTNTIDFVRAYRDFSLSTNQASNP